jgi:hypothetical protein
MGSTCSKAAVFWKAELKNPRYAERIVYASKARESEWLRERRLEDVGFGRMTRVSEYNIGGPRVYGHDRTNCTDMVFGGTSTGWEFRGRFEEALPQSVATVTISDTTATKAGATAGELQPEGECGTPETVPRRHNRPILAINPSITSDPDQKYELGIFANSITS